jgi:hypothetical protein
VLKVLVDEDMPRPTVTLLKSLDIDAVDVRDVGMRRGEGGTLVRK